MKWNKITVGFVIQTYGDDKCIEQEFFAGEQVDYEDMNSEPIDPPENEQDFPFEMIQPSSPQDTTL